MKILVVGATGTIGRAVVAELAARHTVLGASRKGELAVDLTDASSIRALFDRTGPLDAVVSAAGHVEFAPIDTITDAQYRVGLADKLMGQVNLAIEARRVLAPRGSITLTSGILSERYIAAGSSATMVNAALEAWVGAAAAELHGVRINVVSPSVLAESMPGYAPFFRGYEPVPAARVALAYARSVEGIESGRTYRVT